MSDVSPVRATRVDHDALRQRAAKSLSGTPRPFLRWAGSKRALLHHIVEVLPLSYRSYHEPFLGSGSLYFLLRPTHAFLSDSCAALIETFQDVQDNASAVARELKPWKPSRKFFYGVRSNRSQLRYRRAAEFIYLNKTCWNGLYRVNSRGEFNVPFGRPKTDNLADFSNLRACARTLRAGETTLRCCDFEVALKDVAKGDLVFLDPPYVTRHNNNGFVDYNEKLFSWRDQVRLARIARDLSRRGAHVVVTNAHHDDVVRLYRGFHVTPIERVSTLASSATKRSRVSEALLWCNAVEAPIG